MSEKIPGHYSSEKNLGTGVIAAGAFATLLLLIHTLQIAPIVAYSIIVDINKSNWSVVESAIGSFYNPAVTIDGIKYAYALDAVITIAVVFLFFVVSLVPVILAAAKNPYRMYDLIHGDARKGSIADIRKMESRKQVGIRGGKYLHLGLWPTSGESMRLIETLSCLVLAPPGTGKSLSPKEPVLMYDGTVKKTGDIKIGDLLMGPDGKPRRVKITTPGFGQMYRVNPENGRSFECNEDHILSLIDRDGNLHSCQITEWLNLSDEQKKSRNQWRINTKTKELEETSFHVEKIEDGDYFGIVLESIDPDYDHALSKNTSSDEHLYLLDDFTVTHNTASFVVPSILDTPESSFIVNDPKPELFDLTSGYRRQIGHVFMINWSSTDKIDPSNIDDPEKTIFYPRFNPLSPKLLPPAGTAERDTYLDAVANVMSPSNSKGGSSDYFEQKGRAALVGFLHYICSKVADAHPDQIDMTNIPSAMQKPGMEPSIPMLIDMINEGLRNASVKNDEEKEAAAKEGRFYQGDALSDWLKNIVAECQTNQYNPRALTEITPLVSMAPNERSGILGTMDKAFLPFKNAAVRERTSSCDFVPADLRGMPDENGVMKPVTLYVCVNQAEAAAFATITSLLYEILSREYLAYGPGEINRNGTKLGPFPVCFMLDEFAKLPRIEAVMTGPDLGRSKKTMYCLVAQSDAQIGKLYSKEDQQIIYATTAIKYILPQNDKDTIKLVQDMVGPTTIKRSSRSKSKGADLKEWGKSNESTNLEKVDFIRAGDVSGMEPGTHIIMAQGFMNRPYFMKSVFFFNDPEMLAKAYNPRTNKGPKAAYPLPEKVRLARVQEWKRLNGPKVTTGETKRLAERLEKYTNYEEPINA